ncbi:MAG: tetraacyldisaccharide 4'-kinase [Lysobacteraceae bacterium]
MELADLKARWARDLNALWYDPSRRPHGVLRALSALYGVLMRLRSELYRVGWMRRHRVTLPVIVVGNLTVGGAGKTPLTLALIDALRQRGWRPGVISRGYGGSARGPLRVQADTPASVCGDEPKLIAERSAAPLAVARRRHEAAQLLQASSDVDVLIADDGLQHLALARDIELLVIDGQRRFGNQLLLPAGPLRESLTRLREVDWRLCNGGDAQDGEVAMTLRLGEPRALLDPQRRMAFARQRVHAVAGIGDPSRYFASLHRLGIEIIAHPFADHHVYRPDDLAFADDLPVWMTEKDAVKCTAFAQAHWYAVPVDAELPAHFVDQLDQRLRSLNHAPD